MSDHPFQYKFDSGIGPSSQAMTEIYGDSEEWTGEKVDDPINSPSHYNQHGIEAIDAIKAGMSKEAFEGYLKGNTLKYLWRYKYKGKPVEDLKKAAWYLNRLVEENQ